MSDEVSVTDQVEYQPQPLIDVDPPAPVADDKKPDEVKEEPAPPADDKTGNAETPEQAEEKRQSRRARARERAAAELAAAQTEARLLRERLASFEKPVQKDESAEPKREQFEDYEAYLERRAEWIADQKVEQRLNAERQQRESAERQNTAKTQQERVAQDWGKRESEFIKKTPDYVETVTPFVEQEIGVLSDPARQAIIESGPQVLHHLATHPDEVERIAALSPLRQSAEILKLEESVSKPAPARLPTAPDPIKPVPQGRNAPAGYSDNMSTDEYKAWRKTQGATWAR